MQETKPTNPKCFGLKCLFKWCWFWSRKRLKTVHVVPAVHLTANKELTYACVHSEDWGGLQKVGVNLLLCF